MATELTKVVFPTTDYIDLNKYRLLTNNDFDTINVTELNAGDVIVTGAARFLNTINGDISGNAETATSATKATQDESGNNIKNTYASSFSISDHTITLKNKNGTSLGTVTVPDNNTTYTVATGTANGKIKVTPSSGSAYEVSVYGLKSAAYKDVTDSYSATGTNPVSGKAVAAALDSLPEPMIFRGSLGTGGTITALPVDGTAKVGDTYKVITAGTYASKAAKVGDTFICLTKTDSANTWELIPSGDEPNGTVTSVAISNGGGLNVSGSPITSSGTITISHADTSSQASVDNSGRTYIQDISLDTYGHVTKITSATETVVNTDRYVNSAAFADATSADASNPVKMTLTRAGSDTASVTAYLPKISSSSAGVAPKGAAVSSQSQSTKFLREDGTWAAPSYTTNTNTTYTLGADTTNNKITLTPSSGTVQSVTVPYATSAEQDSSGNVIASTYLPKTTYEYNKEIPFGSSGKLLIGKFPCYDSNVTIEINSTTSETYHATAILATQNINDSGGGGINWKTYGDAANTVTPNLYLYYPSNSRWIEIYFSPSSWSKNIIHIQCVRLTTTPTNICESVTEIPAEATTKPINTLLSLNYLPLSGGTMTGQIVLASNGYKTYNSAGYSVDQHGNFTHSGTTTSDYWHLNSNDGTSKFSVYWETGNVTAAGNITAPKFIGALQGNADTATTATTAVNLNGFKNTTSTATAVNDAITNGHYYVNGTSDIYNISDGAAYVQAYSSSWVGQIYQDYRTGQIALRGKNNGTWQSWRKVWDSVNLKSETAAASGTTLSLVTTGEKATWNAKASSDTKNTAGSTDTSSKIYLVGATSQAANPQTYSDNEVYATSGTLTTKEIQVGGGAATMQYNTTTQSIDFVFA